MSELCRTGVQCATDCNNKRVRKYVAESRQLFLNRDFETTIGCSNHGISIEDHNDL